MSKQSTVKYIGLVAAVFTIMGLGLGLTGYMGLNAAKSMFVNPDAGEFAQSIGQLMIGLMFLQTVVVTLFVGPVTAIISGLVSGVSLNSKRDALIAGGAGSFVGFYALIIIAVFIMLSAMGGGGGEQAAADGASSASGPSNFDMGQFFGTAVKASIPTTVAGALGGFLGTKFISVDLTVTPDSRVAQGQSSD